MNRSIQHVVLVGHCAADQARLRQLVVHALGPGVTVESANSDQRLQQFDLSVSLLLINRVLDGRFDADGGVALIQQLMNEHGPLAAMLISNYPKAQEQAMRAGAVRGFGKAQLGDPAAIAILRQALGNTEPSSSQPG